MYIYAWENHCKFLFYNCSEIAFSALSCYVGFAIRGCEVAKAELLKASKLIFETCPLGKTILDLFRCYLEHSIWYKTT